MGIHWSISPSSLRQNVFDECQGAVESVVAGAREDMVDSLLSHAPRQCFPESTTLLKLEDMCLVAPEYAVLLPNRVSALAVILDLVYFNFHRRWNV